jgi:gliding motility-associated-like protein
VNDGPTTYAPSTGGTTTSVLLNDTLSGVPATLTNVTLTATSVSAGITFNTDGTIVIPSSTAGGTYTVVYKICETINPTNCDTATAVVIVSPTLVIDAVNDNYSANIINSLIGGTTASVLVNDTLNGLPVTTANVLLTPVLLPTGIILNANGSIIVASGTMAGLYTITYKICEILNPTNCDTATAMVAVYTPTIVAEDDEYVIQDGLLGGTLGSIYSDNGHGIDTINGTPILVIVNGSPVIVTQVKLTVTTPATPILAGTQVPYIDVLTGNIIVPPATPSGTYTIVYSLCQISNPTVCDSAIISINVKLPVTADDLIIYNNVSANGDGVNDYLFIDGIGNYPDNTVEIYNRWGVLVYEIDGYNNNDKSFRGMSDGRVTVNRDDTLPEGTYYYILRYVKPSNNETKEKSGYLYINR